MFPWFSAAQYCVVSGVSISTEDAGSEYIPDENSSEILINLTFHFKTQSDGVNQYGNFMEFSDGIENSNLEVNATNSILPVSGVNGVQLAEDIVNKINGLIDIGNLPFSLQEAMGNVSTVLPYKHRFILKDVRFYDADESIELDVNAMNVIMQTVTPIESVSLYSANSSSISPYCPNFSILMPSGTSYGGNSYLCSSSLVTINDFWYFYKFAVAQVLNLQSCSNMQQEFENAYNWRVLEVCRMIWHEVGHSFGLRHTILTDGGDVSPVSFSWDPPLSNYFLVEDYCSDTPSVADLLVVFNGCHPADSGGELGGNNVDCAACSVPADQGCSESLTCSNNLMDYCGGHNGRALTPQQLGIFYNCLYHNHLPHLNAQNCEYDAAFDVAIGYAEVVVWPVDRLHRGHIIIESGGELTIKGHVYMPENGQIIVKPGGRLIIDGGCVSTLCEPMWRGIEVWGNNQLSQLPTLNQGYLELKNGASLLNARCAVRLGRVSSFETWTYDWSKTGGIVRATNTDFINNSKDVEFLSYSNFNSSNNEIPNSSFFRECKFIVNKPLNDGATSLGERLSFFDVNGVRIGACKFAVEQDALTVYNAEQRGIGIKSSDSGFRAEGLCVGNPPAGSECIPADITAETLTETNSAINPCIFKNLHYGIRANATTEYPSVVIKYSIFENNYIGVHLLALKEPSLFRNRFYISDQNLDDREFGALLTGCSGYEVKRNFFEGDNQILNARRVGLWIIRSGGDPNEVYLNDFKDLHAGTIAMGTNRSQSQSEQGLEILCGLYENTAYDVSVVKDKTLGGKIALIQGDASENELDITAPAGNIFNNINYTNAENDYHIDQWSAWVVYQHHNPESPYNVVPYESHLGVDIIPSSNSPYMIDRLAACPKIPEVSHLVEKNNTIEHRENAAEIEMVYHDLIDGGNTASIISTLNDPYIESGELRNILIENSPFLSDSVLKAVLVRQPAMNQWHVCEVLLANSPLRPDVWQFYEELSPLAPVLNDLLAAYQTGELSTRDKMAAALKQELLLKHRALGNYIRIQLNNEEVINQSEILTLLSEEEQNMKLKKEFSYALEAGDLTTAGQKLEAYDENEDYGVWKQVMQLKLSIESNGGYSSDNSTHISTLQMLANSGKLGSDEAAALFENLTGQPIADELIYPEFSTKRANVNKTKGSSMNLTGVYPNPADNEFYITYILPEHGMEALVNIFDGAGALVRSEDISKGYGILTLNARLFANGTYVYQLVLEGRTIESGKFIISH